MKPSDFPININQHLQLRPFLTTDAPHLALHANNPKIAENLNDGFPSPYSLTDARDFIRRMREDQPAKVLAIVIDGEACGAIGIFIQQNVQRLTAELGYWISEMYWGKGYTTAAVKVMIKYAFDTFDVIRLYARPFPFNIASQKVLEHSGFKLEARLKNGLYKHNTIYDELIYSILKEEVQV